eukprot:TRINITY_DN12653_c0_g6_i1.p1 TRINITY_DN12653_c0_g6~~TRINITY_DN12653_c0_g6_i1.p1  ORF type:complete len:319 (+),score=25.73 TRINITY_DN12653_c0_g6_i1:30-959(+)
MASEYVAHHSDHQDAKRMRMDTSSDEPMRGQYNLANSFLNSLHEARLQRQPAPRSLGSALGSPLETRQAEVADVEEWSGQTSFVLADIVSCGHGTNGRCLECTGRQVTNVPVTVYSEYCKAFEGVRPFTHPGPLEAAAYAVPSRSLVAGECSFASFASLLADAHTSQIGERFLDLGSGVARAVIAFALLFPNCSSAGIEIRPSLHEVACSALARLKLDVQQRVSLHLGDMFTCSWSEATLLLVNSTGFDEYLMARVAEKLEDAPAATTVITLSQPLPSIAPSFRLVHTARYKMTWGNATAFIYKRGVQS